MSAPDFDYWGNGVHRWQLRPKAIPDVWLLVGGGEVRLSLYQEEDDCPSQPMTPNEARELAGALLRAADAIDSDEEP